MKCVHLIPNGVFAKKFIARMNNEFGADNNTFLVYRMKEEPDMEESGNIHMIDAKTKNVFERFFTLLRYDKVFLHNLSRLDPRLMILLSLVPKFVIKQYWVLWGMDLYCYQNKKETMKEKLHEAIRRRFIKNVFGIIFWVKGEYDLACKWYKTKAKYFKGGYSEDNRAFLRELSENAKKSDGTIRIQVGNSAAPMNKHIEALRKLKEADRPDMIIYSPLSYAGTEEYVKSVIDEGKKLFEDRFVSLTELMPKEEYVKYLNDIDIGVFNTDRQMGLGNISTMLALGKKVYMNDYITVWDHYKGNGCHIFSFNALDFSSEEGKTDFFTLLTEKQKETNSKKTMESIAAFGELWNNIFSS